jgi:hypothetical protein
MRQIDNDLIGKIYDSATNPGDWLSLVEAITEWTQFFTPPKSSRL